MGAGASKEAGILTGVDMARTLAAQLKNKYEQKELAAKMSELGIEDIKPNSANYFNLYNLRFYPDYRDGNAYLERELEKGSPGLGHYVLAKILAGTKNNLVITTNFDNLIEDALFIFTPKRPLIVGHEALTEFIDFNTSRPIIAKIHRGLYYQPFNSTQSTNELKDGWQKALEYAFMTYTPVVIGYGGGDQSLMKFLQKEDTDIRGLYWCYWRKEEPAQEIIELVKNKDGCLVPIDGFDQMMFMLSRKFEFENPSEDMRAVTEARIAQYNKQEEEFSKKLNENALTDPESQETLEEYIDQNEKRLQELTEKIAINNSAEDYFRRGLIWVRMAKYQEAIDDFTKAIEGNSNDSEFYFFRGLAYIFLKKYEEALADYNKAIELKADDADYYYNRGITYGNLEKYNEALTDCNKAIELKADDARHYNNRGVVYERLERYNEALTDYNKAIELKGDDAEYYNNRAEAYIKLEIYDKATTDCLKAIELDNNLEEPYYFLAQVYFETKEFQKALDILNEAIKFESIRKQSYKLRAKVYRETHQLDLAEIDENTAQSLET